MEELPVNGLYGSNAEMRLEYAISQAWFAQRCANKDAADQYDAILTTVEIAREHPELFVGPEKPDLTPRERRERLDLAVRAAVADLAVRMRLPENTVRMYAYRAQQLRSLAPTIWGWFRDGDISVGNANVVADLVGTLPEGVCAAFDEDLRQLACDLPTPRFREKAGRLREKLDPQPLAERHGTAREARRVWFEADLDGMCWINAFLPADVGKLAMTRLDATAASLAAAQGETRTMDQLRADVFGDLLIGVGSAAPVGVEELPGDLEGYGPIDPDTARRLAGHASSFQRILTHPITGTVLDIDRDSYKPPADLKRWTQMRDQRCTFAGCGRPAKQCDLDHTTAWAHNGPTRASNLAHLCRHHHRLKHETKWSVSRARTAPPPGPPPPATTTPPTHPRSEQRQVTSVAWITRRFDSSSLRRASCTSRTRRASSEFPGRL